MWLLATWKLGNSQFRISAAPWLEPWIPSCRSSPIMHMAPDDLDCGTYDVMSPLPGDARGITSSRHSLRVLCFRSNDDVCLSCQHSATHLLQATNIGPGFLEFQWYSLRSLPFRSGLCPWQIYIYPRGPSVSSSGSRGTGLAPIAPKISSKSCRFKAILREKYLFWANLGLTAPSGFQTPRAPLTKILDLRLVSPTWRVDPTLQGRAAPPSGCRLDLSLWVEQNCRTGSCLGSQPPLTWPWIPSCRPSRHNPKIGENQKWKFNLVFP